MPLCANYGGTLQNWALQQVLKKMGHDPITLRFPVMFQGISSLHYWTRVFPIQALRFVAHKFIEGKCEMPLTIGLWKKNVSGMERFVNEHINVTEYLPNLNMDDVRKYGIEALIVGSDQIWRPVMYDAVKYYFLGFTVDSDILRIAYAPSVALDEWPYKEDVTVKLRELIKKFSAVSVREESSVKLIKDNLGVEAQWVLDPTMLLSKEDYLEICKGEPPIEEPFVFAYILDMTEEKQNTIKKIANIQGCSIRILTADKTNENDTIEKWLNYFRDSQYVITDSFHGTVFSLIFQKQFYCFYNNTRGNARIDSLKKITGLDKRFIKDSFEELDYSIDYTVVNKKIDIMRNTSMSFLVKAISQL